jgi:hypothetical protein
MQQNMNSTAIEPNTQAVQPTVRHNFNEEVGRLRDDLMRTAHELRMKSKGASAEVQSTLSALEREAKRFSDEVANAAEETGEDLKQVGDDLRIRFQKLANQIVMPSR